MVGLRADDENPRPHFLFIIARVNILTKHVSDSDYSLSIDIDCTKADTLSVLTHHCLPVLSTMSCPYWVLSRYSICVLNE